MNKQSNENGPKVYDVKRLLEIKNANLYSDEVFFRDAAQIMALHNALYDPALIEALREPDAAKQHPLFDQYRRETADTLAWRDQIRKEGAAENPAMKKWRERQMKRCVLEIGESQCQAITFPPLAFELAEGCSVGCWFCALNAGPLKTVVPYTRDNAALWKGLLHTAKSVIGPAVRYAVSYWATEPLDNGDYEYFCRDMAEILGLYPQTTTAVPLRKVSRTKELLQDSYKKGCRINRFSVHSGELLLKIHQSFSAKELRHTELILENDESANIMVRSGKLFDLERRDPDAAQRQNQHLTETTFRRNPDLKEQFDQVVIRTDLRGEAPQSDGQLQLQLPGTTACLAGFLTKLPARTVELISPCAADAENPMGYIVHDSGSFDSAEDFRLLIEEMIKRNMHSQIQPHHLVSLSKRFRYEPLENGFAAATVFAKVQFQQADMGPYLRRLGELLHQGNRRAWEIALECCYTFSKPEEMTYRLLNEVFEGGILDESLLEATHE